MSPTRTNWAPLRRVAANPTAPMFAAVVRDFLQRLDVEHAAWSAKSAPGRRRHQRGSR